MPLVNYIYKNLSANIKAVTKNIQLKVAAQKVSVANADIKNKPKVLLAVDVTDIYTNIYINCNVNYPYEEFLVDGVPFKLIDGRIFKVLKNELQQ